MAATQSNNLGIASLVLGIVSLISWILFVYSALALPTASFIMSLTLASVSCVVGLILGIMQLRKKHTKSGIAGIVINSLSVIILILLMVRIACFHPDTNIMID
jgi:hypothetical protein